MDDKTSKILSISLYVLIGISVLLTVIFFAGFISEALLLEWAYLLVGIATLASLVFPIMFLVQNPGKAKGALVSVVGLVIVFGISYAMASGDVLVSYEKYDVDEGLSKMVGMGIMATYLLGLGAIGAIIYSAISQMFK